MGRPSEGPGSERAEDAWRRGGGRAGDRAPRRRGSGSWGTGRAGRAAQPGEPARSDSRRLSDNVCLSKHPSSWSTRPPGSETARVRLSSPLTGGFCRGRTGLGPERALQSAEGSSHRSWALGAGGEPALPSWMPGAILALAQERPDQMRDPPASDPRLPECRGAGGGNGAGSPCVPRPWGHWPCQNVPPPQGTRALFMWIPGTRPPHCPARVAVCVGSTGSKGLGPGGQGAAWLRAPRQALRLECPVPPSLQLSARSQHAGLDPRCDKRDNEDQPGLRASADPEVGALRWPGNWGLRFPPYVSPRWGHGGCRGQPGPTVGTPTPIP